MEFLNKIAVRDRVLVLVALAMSAFLCFVARVAGTSEPRLLGRSLFGVARTPLVSGIRIHSTKRIIPARGFGLLGVHSFHLLLAARHHRRFRPTVLRDRTFRLDIPARFTNS